MERLRALFDRLNITRIDALALALAIALVLVPRLTMAPLPPAPTAPAAPQAVGHAPVAAPEQPPPPRSRRADPDRPLAVAPPPAAPHAQPRPGHEPPPPSSRLGDWLGWIGHWLAVTVSTTFLACLVLIGLLLWRSWSLRERDIATQI